MTSFTKTCRHFNVLLRCAAGFAPRNAALTSYSVSLYPAVTKFRCFYHISINKRLANSWLYSHAVSRTKCMFCYGNQLSTNPGKSFAAFLRKFHDDSKESEKKSVPKLLYMQNPLTWLINKLDFGVLRRTWDPQFDEAEFRRGTKQAVSTITHLISQNMFESLKGLLTPPALTFLQYEVETTWIDEQRRLVALDPEDVQLAVPRRVHFQRISDQKFCDVDMVFIALKWAEHRGANAIIFVEIIARFHREYSEERLPDWTISLFRVTRFSILPR